MHTEKIKESMTRIQVKESNDPNIYKLIPNYSLGEFVFDTNIQKYLRGKKFEVTINQDPSVGNMYQFFKPNISLFIDNRNVIESVTCHYKCYLFDNNIINMNINYAIKEVFKREPNLIESLWTFYKEKEVKELVYDFDDLGIQVWTYKNKIVTIVCSNLDDTTGPSSV